MDMEMSGVTAWSFFLYRHPQGVLPPDCIPSIVFLFSFQTILFYFWPYSHSEDTKYMNHEQQ
mgnify:CR=1 FL=1|jgi:hypothetical protein